VRIEGTACDGGEMKTSTENSSDLYTTILARKAFEKHLRAYVVNDK